jgi:glycerol-3-phosphate acyltransferase PlsX
MREKIDYAEYGGAPLLGVNGVMIIAHGRSDARAICSAVRVARRMVETDINKHITEEIHALTEQA